MDPILFEAACSGDLNSFHSLLAQDPLILDRVSLNSVENPLHIASLAGHIGITGEVVSRKPAFARELNGHGFNPLHIAPANGHVEIVREILRVVMSDVCLLRGKDGKLALHCAAMKGRVDAVKELVSACPDSIKEVTDRGETALHVAVKSNQFEVIGILMEEIKRLNMVEIVNWKDKDGNTVLHLATFRKQHETIAMLIGENANFEGIDINSVNSSGFTPMDVLDFVIQGDGLLYEIDILEMFQRAEAMKAREITTMNLQVQASNIPRKPTTLSSVFSKWNLWKELTREIEESSMDTQNALMVVAVLIATVTYQATLSPPSGFLSGETRKSQILTVQRRGVVVGEAVMANDPEVFTVFTVFNAIGFFASLGMISLLTSGFPLRAGLRLGILSMAATYVISVIYEAPTSMRTVIVVVGFTGVLVLMEVARFAIWLMQKWGILSGTRARRRFLP